MTQSDKFRALMALCSDVNIQMDTSGQWYLNAPGIERKEGPFLSSGGCLHMLDPMAAIDSYWTWATKPDCYLVRNSYKGREAFRWNGFMWDRVGESTEKAAGS